MKTKIRVDELAPLAEFINENYQGDLAEISHDLNRVIYLLHYLGADDVGEQERQEACYTLHHISDRLYSSQANKSSP